MKKNHMFLEKKHHLRATIIAVTLTLVIATVVIYTLLTILNNKYIF